MHSARVRGRRDHPRAALAAVATCMLVRSRGAEKLWSGDDERTRRATTRRTDRRASSPRARLSNDARRRNSSSAWLSSRRSSASSRRRPRRLPTARMRRRRRRRSAADPPRDDRRADARDGEGSAARHGPRRLVAAGDGTHWAMALASAKRDGPSGAPHLLLFDVSAPEGLLDCRARLRRRWVGIRRRWRASAAVLLLDASSRDEPVVLAGDCCSPTTRASLLVGACVRWLRRRRAMFACAPRLTPTSRFETHDGQLVETWQVDALGGNATAMAPARAAACCTSPTASAVETDSLLSGTPLDQWKQVGSRRWRRGSRRPSSIADEVGDARRQRARRRHRNGTPARRARGGRLRPRRHGGLLGRLSSRPVSRCRARIARHGAMLALRDDGVLLRPRRQPCRAGDRRRAAARVVA